MRSWMLAVMMLVPGAPLARAQAAEKEPAWHFNAQYIEACSCNLFCSCYMDAKPDKDFCKMNNAIRVKSGHYGDVKLDGMKIWMSGDLGTNFAKGEAESLILTFEPSASQAQVDAAVKCLAHIYPVKPKQAAIIDRAPILWEVQGDKAHAKLGDGQGEVMLTAQKGPNGRPVVINNLKYWGADRNKGFNLYRSEHHYKGHGQAYSYTDANGFTIEIDTGSPANS